MLSMASISVLPHQAGERASGAKLGRSDTSMNERLFTRCAHVTGSGCTRDRGSPPRIGLGSLDGQNQNAKTTSVTAMPIGAAIG